MINYTEKQRNKKKHQKEKNKLQNYGRYSKNRC